MAARYTALSKAITDLGYWYAQVTGGDFMALLLQLASDADPPGVGVQQEIDLGSAEAGTATSIIQYSSAKESSPINNLLSKLQDLSEGGSYMADFITAVDGFIGKGKKEEKGLASHKAIMDAVTGAGSNKARLWSITYDAKAQGTDYTNSCKSTIRDVLEFATDNPINEKGETPSKESPGLCVMQYHQPALNYANRDTGAAGIFMHAIPSIEMSRCVPYMDCQVITAVPPVVSSGEDAAKQSFIGEGISIYKFLEGRKELTGDMASWTPWLEARQEQGIPPLNDTTPTNEPGEPAKITAAGMEIFTSPQTLTNGNEPFSDIGPAPAVPLPMVSPRATPVIDKFRPLMTLKELNIKVAPSVGLLTTKTCEMTLVLHDRSRLSEISQMVAPGELNRVSFLIEFGWSHPDPSSPYGALLNSMRSREKFGVMNSAYTFQPNGEVEITLKLISKGSHEMQYKLITDTPECQHPMKSLNNLMKEITDLKKRIKGMDKDYAENLFGDSIMGKCNSVSALMKMEPKHIKKILKEIKSMNKAAAGESSPDLSTALSVCATAFEDSLKDMKSYQEAIDALIQKKFANIKKYKKHGTNLNFHDPFLKPGPANGTDINGQKYVSMAKVMLNFIGEPIAASGRYDEVQMFFYPMNPWCAFARDDDTGSFPIDKEVFIAKMNTRLKQSPTFNLGTLVGFLNKHFYANMACAAFGFGSLYTRGKGGKAEVSKKYKSKKGAKKGRKIKQDCMAKAYGTTTDLKFKKPSIQIQIETVPGMNKQGLPDDSISICRIHVYDSAAASYPGFAEMWNSVRTDNAGLVNTSAAAIASPKTDPATVPDHKGTFAAQMKLLGTMGEGVVQFVDEKGAVVDGMEGGEGKVFARIKGGPAGLRYLFSRYMPTIRYGSEFSAIIGCNLATNSDPKMQVIYMQREAKDPNIPDAEMDDGLPMQAMPVKLSMESFGCPQIHVGQQFFVDFGTGTTLDNIYRIGSIDHKLAPSEFTTTFDMYPMGATGAYNNMLDKINKAVVDTKDAAKKAGK